MEINTASTAYVQVQNTSSDTSNAEEPDFIHDNVVWSITEKGRATGITMEYLTGKSPHSTTSATPFSKSRFFTFRMPLLTTINHMIPALNG
ncbi:hypothetical protein HC231_05635 [Brenneria izadpanahii]|uniref:Uncharacterized protein n=1 Tax=Brenneria izadpanahii TaxID=2722756 RepID=A0ABX7UV11_9GAMM|nr:hypothetical protein [Brenneria izadpanahii]QTF07459.1 hypothetical protein HC231_05635 [Brenneria izadpanahii]